MSGISSKGMYGLAAMYQLLQSEKGVPIQIKEIADKADIPKNYLEQILVILKRDGIVKSIRGASGGYMLNKNPEDILIYDIIDSLEGGLCNEGSSSSNEILNLFWREKQSEVRNIFNIPLTELKNFEQKYNKQIMYVI
ncbi:MAG: Rrf2 family transcriptional regulator [Sulfurimonas sp.]|uniref:RrF2 family transcriptional regulator n=1 Tax=Sulfurimonas sp. TaxID=2022749 RepID=UPI00261549A2|nr:Rrf2 family transcriptional regulator [Sulfurimonas sp.]MCW8896359.1 Rrf2 family transcriptional regulator [Sulfurimonas sp.]MCW8953737.1 Rrf2 family transcriptional regulator [Sulfurimonas sp.]MCW9068320.1 Rrf2 family transcriptional regulator [Sulfurimonas sp.]